jgi:hypothetical protein
MPRLLHNDGSLRSFLQRVSLNKDTLLRAVVANLSNGWTSLSTSQAGSPQVFIVNRGGRVQIQVVLRDAVVAERFNGHYLALVEDDRELGEARFLDGLAVITLPEDLTDYPRDMYLDVLEWSRDERAAATRAVESTQELGLSLSDAIQARDDAMPPVTLHLRPRYMPQSATV